MSDPSDQKPHQQELALLQAQAELKDSEANVLEKQAQNRQGTAALITAIAAVVTALGGIGIWQVFKSDGVAGVDQASMVTAATTATTAAAGKIRTKPAFLPDSTGRVLDPTNCLPGSLQAAADDVDECREVVAGKMEADNIVRDVRWLDASGVAWKIYDADYEPVELEAICSCQLAKP